MTKRFKLILIVRFFGYLLLLIGLTILVFILEPVMETELKYRLDQAWGVKRSVPSDLGNLSDLSTLRSENPAIVPISTEFGIVIEKINANAKIIPNVDAGDEKAYIEALKQGVAQALGSTLPGIPGNLYLFSHSTDAPWNIVRFNAVFYLLRELDKGDRVIIFYDHKRYDYIVFDKTITGAEDVSFLTNRYNIPVLTLQTCDPPGTLLRRLIVRAKMI